MEISAKGTRSTKSYSLRYLEAPADLRPLVIIAFHPRVCEPSNKTCGSHGRQNMEISQELMLAPFAAKNGNMYSSSEETILLHMLFARVGQDRSGISIFGLFS